jgi:hypothetical protein
VINPSGPEGHVALNPSGQYPAKLLEQVLCPDFRR